DGTLLNRDDSIKYFIEDQYERLKSKIGFIRKESFMKRFIELDHKGYVWKDKVYKQLIDEFDITKISQEELLVDYKENFKNNCVPFPNLHFMLKKLQQNKMSLGIITNGKGQFQMDNIKALGINSYFETILVSEWEGIKKPNPEIFKRAVNQLNVFPHECIFIGDHPENDVKAAKYLGMKGIWKKDQFWYEVEADFIIEDLAELALIVQQLNTEKTI
ncbi:HAD family hydrolase, partial [Bacillus sp. JJ722]|uniref:HAD family hydrolase n=1 Tax=Bacillus sp. JJ722 TaxID=3122973 RepID=UPI002FFF6F74